MDTADEHRVLIEAALRREDFDPFLQAAQAGTADADELLGSPVPASLARLAIRQQREARAQELTARLLAAGIPPARVPAILDGAVRFAQEDLERALDWHLEVERRPSWRAATSEDYTQHAYALLDAEAAKLVGEPYDQKLLADEWPALRP